MADALLADVFDSDCVVSTNPLVFDDTCAFVKGPAAILRRILWRWCQSLGFVSYAPDLGLATPLLDIDGATFSREDLSGLKGQLTKQAMAEDFVTDAVVILTLTDAGLFTVSAVITMTDGGRYPLEVEAIGAINQLGNLNLTGAQLEAIAAALRAVIGA